MSLKINLPDDFEEKVFIKKKKRKKKKFNELNDIVAKNKDKPKKMKKKKKKKSIKDSIYSKTKRSPGIVVRKSVADDPEGFKNWLNTTPGFIEGLTSTHDEPTKLYDYQHMHMYNPSPFKHIDKSRQVGMSFLFSCQGLAECHIQIKKDYKAIFISIRQEEANEKITFARALYESMPAAYKLNRVVDNKQSLEFETMDGKYRTRMLSYPQREPRGKGHNAHVVLDEIAHYTWQREIYIASVPIITRGGGTLTLGSSPLGKKGTFYDVKMDRKTYNMFTLQSIPWWTCPEFIIEPDNLEEAKRLCPFLETRERVNTFGNMKVHAIFNSMPLEDFQQEYEVLYIDESTALVTLEMINNCSYPVIDDDSDSLSDPDFSDKLNKFPIQEKFPNYNFKYYNTVDELVSAIQRGDVSRNLIFGWDLGRKRDNSELVISEEKRKCLIVRCIISLKTVAEREYSKQKEVLWYAISKLRPKKVGMDGTGKGEQLAEETQKRFGSHKVKVYSFTMTNKATMASKTQILFETQQMAIPEDKELKSQIHSMGKKITEASNVIITSEGDSSHHGDKFWALAICSDLSRLGAETAEGPIIRNTKSDLERHYSSQGEKRHFINGPKINSPSNIIGIYDSGTPIPSLLNPEGGIIQQ